MRQINKNESAININKVQKKRNLDFDRKENNQVWKICKKIIKLKNYMTIFEQIFKCFFLY